MDYIYILRSSNSNTIYNNKYIDNYYGIYLYISSNNNLIKKNTISNSTNYGIFISSSSYNRIYANFFLYNNGATDVYNSAHIQAYDAGSNNYWNSTSGYGNYWSDWTSPDANGDGIVDNPYKIDGSAGAYDYYPLTTPVIVPEFSTGNPLILMLLVVFVLILVRKLS